MIVNALPMAIGDNARHRFLMSERWKQCIIYYAQLQAVAFAMFETILAFKNR